MDEQTCSVADQYGCLQCKYDVPVATFDKNKTPINDTEDIFKNITTGNKR